MSLIFCHAEPAGEASHSSINKSLNFGFIDLIKFNFFALVQPLIFFSAAIASSGELKFSYQTNLLTLYFEVNPEINLFLCSNIRLSKSFVTPVYKTVLFLFVAMYVKYSFITFVTLSD